MCSAQYLYSARSAFDSVGHQAFGNTFGVPDSLGNPSYRAPNSPVSSAADSTLARVSTHVASAADSVLTHPVKTSSPNPLGANSVLTRL